MLRAMDGHEHAGHHETNGIGVMAASATLHCLTGCAIGEIVGLVIGTSAGLGNAGTVAVSVALAFLFGYTLSTLPLLRAGLALGTALSVVLAADTLSIAVMEVVDNLVVLVVPGAMDAGLVNAVFWLSLALSLVVAFLAAYPVNRALLQRGKGHALTHSYHGAAAPTGARRFIPSFATGTLVTAIAAFLLGGLVVSLAVEGSDAGTDARGYEAAQYQL
jgi:preprotein translocase subunit SecG